MELLFRIALLAGWYAVTLRALTAACDWNDMVHRELFGRKASAAVMANALSQLIFPPLGALKFLRLFAFASDVRGICGYRVPVIHRE